MIMRRNKSKFLFISFQVIAVAIICFGSLINFHQYKIWGKPLIPTFIGYKRDIEKYAKVFSVSKLSGNGHFDNQYSGNADGVFASETCRLGRNPVSFTIPVLSQDFLKTPRTCSCGLRAPPLV
jgi:hypothetical protein